MKKLAIPSMLILAVSAVLVTNTAAQTPPGQTLAEQVKAAYDNLDAYQATLDFRIQQRSGRWLNTQQTQIYTAYDRKKKQLLIDKPEFRLVVHDNDLMVESKQLPGSYLDHEAPHPLTLGGLIQTVPLLEQPVLLDLAFALQEQPLELLTGGETARATPLGPDDQGRQRMEVGAPQGRLEFFIDPQTSLIDEAIFHLNLQSNSPEDFARIRYDYTYTFGENIPKNTFAFQEQGRQPFDTLDQWMQQSQLAGGSNNTNPDDANNGYVLADKPAPPFDSVVIEETDGEVKAFKLADIEQPVVMLHFWASWLPAAYDSMPKLEELIDWAEREKLPLAIYSVNSGDSIQEIRQFLRNQKITHVPVIRDMDYALSDLYQAHTIPLTVIMVDGEVKAGITGYADNMVELLQQQLKPYLDKVEQRENAENSPE